MKANIENWSVVLVGAWNTAIVTPEWMNTHLGLNGTAVQIEFPIANPTLPIRYSFQNVRLVVVRDRVIIAPTSNDPVVLERVETVAKTLLRTLAHTPMTALGINFEFIEDDVPEQLKKIFPQEDVTRIAAADFVAGDTEVRRELRRSQEQDGVMKLALRRSNSDVTIHLNFHKDVRDATTATTYLEGRVSRCRDLALRFLRDVYAVELEETQPA